MSFRTLLAAVVTLAMTAPAAARDYVSLAGSSTVFPFATIVAENLAKILPLKPQSLNPVDLLWEKREFVMELGCSSSILEMRHLE